MKKFFTICLLSMMYLFAFAQISKSDYDKLPQEVKDQISQSLSPEYQAEQKLKETSTYVSIGHEIGLAVNETLSALKETVIDVSETRIGKTAIAIVVWKLLGKDFVDIFIGVALLIVSIIFAFKFIQYIKTLASRSDIPESEAGGYILGAIIAAIMFVVIFTCATHCYL